MTKCTFDSSSIKYIQVNASASDVMILCHVVIVCHFATMDILVSKKTFLSSHTRYLTTAIKQENILLRMKNISWLALNILTYP